MIYVDALFDANPLAHAGRNPLARQAAKHGTRWCHMWPSSAGEAGLEELHQMARAIGLRRDWFQVRAGRATGQPDFPHYDLVPTKRRLAIEHGAVEMDLGRWLAERRQNSVNAGHQTGMRQGSLF